MSLQEDSSIEVRSSSGSEIIDTISILKLPKGFTDERSWYVAEAEIPMAKTSEDLTWEIRTVVPFSDWSFCKVGETGHYVNNIAQGGRVGSALEIVTNVFNHHFTSSSLAEIEAYTHEFIRVVDQLSCDVKAFTDFIQVEIAKRIILPQDFLDPSHYERVIRECFSGSFFTVDITGTFIENKLHPIIVEAQPSAALPNLIAYEAYQRTSAILRDKLTILQFELK